MKIKAILLGSTGMIGQAVLMEALQNPEVEALLVINRQSLGLQHPRLKELIWSDFYDLSPITAELQGYDTCFFCIGVSAMGLSEMEYYRLTYEMTTAVAKKLLEINPGLTFCYISGSGTDSSEQGRMMWARVKGKTENALLAMPFKKVYMFRPGYIQPLEGIRSKTPLYNTLYSILKPLYFLLKPLKTMVTDTRSMAKAMIRVAAHGYDRPILESADINRVAGQKG